MNLRGVIPAALTPWLEDLSLDKVSLDKHLSVLLSTPGTVGVLVNGNTSEVGACSDTEQAELISAARFHASGDQVVLSGIQLGDISAIADSAKLAQECGVHGFVVYPPLKVVETDPEGTADIEKRWRVLAQSTGLPLILFQYPKTSGKSYSLKLIERLATEIPNFAGVKDFCNDEKLHKKTIDLMHDRFNLPVVTSHTKWLEKSLFMGADGICSTAGCIFSEMQGKVLRHWNNRDEHSLKNEIRRLDEAMSIFVANGLPEQLPKFKVGVTYRGDFSGVSMRAPLQTVSDLERKRIHALLSEMKVFHNSAAPPARAPSTRESDY